MQDRIKKIKQRRHKGRKKDIVPKNIFTKRRLFVFYLICSVISQDYCDMGSWRDLGFNNEAGKSKFYYFFFRIKKKKKN